MKKLLGIGYVVDVNLGGAVGVKSCKVFKLKKDVIEVKTHPRGRKVHIVSHSKVDLSTAERQ